MDNMDSRESDEPEARLSEISIVIADGNATFRAGVSAALRASGFSVVAEAHNATTAVAAAIRHHADLCLIDIDMPGDGLNAVSAIARRSPSTTIVVLTASSESEDLLAALERGASGYLLKTIAPDELAKTLRAARNGQPALSRAMVPVLIRQVRGRPQRRITLPDGQIELSVREWDVAELLRDGLNTVEIGRRLGISPVTVRRHVAAVLKKLGARSRPDAIQLLKVFAR
jgi:two-component system nitrate/nitrite response regulator NarL